MQLKPKNKKIIDDGIHRLRDNANFSVIEPISPDQLLRQHQTKANSLINYHTDVQM